MMGFDGWEWGWMGWMMIPMVLFWGGIIALIIWGVVRATRRSASPETGNKHSSLDIARERYARGEIAREEFEQIKRDLA